MDFRVQLQLLRNFEMGTLNHEIFDNSMKYWTFVAFAFFWIIWQFVEIFDGFWNQFAKKANC